jgi:hypothetical protein
MNLPSQKSGMLLTLCANPTSCKVTIRETWQPNKTERATLNRFGLQMTFRIVRFVLWAFVLAYISAIAIYLIGTFGLFGEQKDPLSGVFLILLGQPWIMFSSVLPQGLLPWAGLLAPLLNVFLIWIALKFFFDWG